jgi:glutamate racemase
MSAKLKPDKNATTKNNSQNIIGVFDSGFGGLTVFKHFLKELPSYNYIYLGDNARVPYGEKSPETIYQFSQEAVDFLFQAGCNLIIVACNTVSAQALRRLQIEYLPKHYPERRILGVIRPLAESVAKIPSLKKIGVIGTKATIASQAYVQEIHKLRPDIQITEQAAPLLVPLIEEGWLKKPETKMILKKYLRPLKTKQIRALILGCTHYPLLRSAIEQIVGRRVLVLSPGEIIADSLKNYLHRHQELGLHEIDSPARLYYTTDDVQKFKKLGEYFLQQKMDNVTQIKITAL